MGGKQVDPGVEGGGATTVEPDVDRARADRRLDPVDQIDLVVEDDMIGAGRTGEFTLLGRACGRDHLGPRIFAIWTSSRPVPPAAA